MWKCVSKSIKGVLQLNQCKCWKVPTTKFTQNKKCDYVIRLSPVIVEHLNRYYGYYKSCCGENTSKEKHHKERKAKKGFSFDDLQHNWLDNLRSWSVIAIVGFYFLHPFAAPRRISSPSDFETKCLGKSTKYLRDFLPGSNSVCYILPEVQASKINKSDTATASGASSNHNKVPVEDAKLIEMAHEKVLDALNNLKGTEYMQLGKHKEAVKFFKKSAEANNAAGIFNLGICYENGLGIAQDFIKAAELYRKAADLGHATAMYNLGVFHAHGWGGVEQSPSKAKELFKAAANLGQVDARKLLHMELEEPYDISEDNTDLKKSTSQVQSEPEHSEPSTSSGGSRRISSGETLKLENSDAFRKKNLKEEESKMTDPTVLFYQIIGLEDIQIEKNSKKKVEQLSSVDSGVLDLSSEDALDIFV